MRWRYDDIMRNTDSEPVKLPALPFDLEWRVPSADWRLEDGSFFMTAAEKTDLFTDPQGSPPVHNAPALLFAPEGDFVFSAKIKLKFKATFDAGVLLIYQNEGSWAKLCFEYAPHGFPLVVSVVTKGTSDDCNSLFLDENATYLRVSRMGHVYAFHHSFDGEEWHLVRVFALEPGAAQVGFLVQSPVGEGCTAEFYKIVFKAETLGDIRSGE